jgi:hypothetical protein
MTFQLFGYDELNKLTSALISLELGKFIVDDLTVILDEELELYKLQCLQAEIGSEDIFELGTQFSY